MKEQDETQSQLSKLPITRPDAIDFFLGGIGSLKADAYAARTVAGRSEEGRVWSILSTKCEELQALTEFYFRRRQPESTS